jgi:error-prone DNA polymerase
MFVELAVRTHFSFLRGGSSPAALVQRASELGYGALGVADCDGLYGLVRTLEAAEQRGVRIVVGCEVTLDGEPGFVWLHVATRDGYGNLCRILTSSHARSPARLPGVTVETVCEHAGGLWAMLPSDTRFSKRSIALLREAFGERLSTAVWRHLDGCDEQRRVRAVRLAQRSGIAPCATARVLFATPSDKPIFDVLHCIRKGTTLDEAGRDLLPNVEAYLKSPAEVQSLFADQPAWIERSELIADACRFSLRELKYRFPCEPEALRAAGHGEADDATVLPGETADAALRRLTEQGARTRWPGGVPHAVALQIEKELLLIAKLEVAPYFLSVRSIVAMARAKDILCQGRGSAANSAVCFCLGVTAVDPARSNLLFERFLSLERREPPDIDVDFEHERREEVIQALYDKYGRDRAAMVSEVISYRAKSALRDVGKVFGLSIEQIGRLGRLASFASHRSRLGDVAPGDLARAGFDPNDARVRGVLAMARSIQKFPRHLSIHVGGFVLSAEPLVNVAPVEPAAMPGRTIVPWDKDDLDTLGFFKVDVLALGMLTAIRKALAMVQHDDRVRAPTAIDRLARIPAEDPRVYEALCAADTVGVFQIESRAQMAMLPRLQPRLFYDLVIEVAIVRPGPIQGGMVHPYLKRRSGEEPVLVPHPALEPILSRTLGVPLFQEQVMQIAIAGAGYTGGEADQLRRDMAAWRRTGKLERHRARLLDGFRRHGISDEFGQRLYRSIEGFGEYGFPESHAASFALLVYSSAWLKVHHPAAFAASLLNSQPMGFYSPATIVSDAERHGVDVLPPRVDASDWDSTLEGGDPSIDGDSAALRLGLRLVKGLGEPAGRRIEAARRDRAFTGIEDLRVRAALEAHTLEILARAGTLEGFGLSRREALWKAHAPDGGTSETLFEGLELGGPMPRLPVMTRAEQLVLDYRTTAIAVGDHAMKVVRPRLPPGCKSAIELLCAPHGTTVSTAGVVICRQRPQTARGVVFITLEDETGFINLILWSSMFERWRQVATESAMLFACGKVERQGAVAYVLPARLERLTLDALPAMSRDFH